MVYSLERQSWSKVYASVSLDKSTADNNTDTVTTTNHPLSSSPSSSSSSSSFDNDYRVTGTPQPSPHAESLEQKGGQPVSLSSEDGSAPVPSPQAICTFSISPTYTPSNPVSITIATTLPPNNE